MGANRVSALSAPKRAAPPSLWAVSTPGMDAVAARRTGALDLFSLSSGQRISSRVTRIPLDAGIPHAVALRPATLAGNNARTAVTTASGALLLDGVEVASLGRAAVGPGGHAPSITALAYHPSAIVAAGGADNALLVVHPATHRVLHRHALTASHPVPAARLAVAVDGRSVLVCSQALTQVSVETGELLKRFISSPSLSTAAIALPGSVQRFATANASRYISIWDAAVVEMGKKKKESTEGDASAETPSKRRRSGGDVDNSALVKDDLNNMNAPTASLLVPSAAMVTALSADMSKKGGMALAALLRGGQIAVWLGWRANAADGVKKPVPASLTVWPPGPEVSLHVAVFTGSGQLSVLYGNTLKPTAHTLRLNETKKGDLTLPRVDDNVIVGGANISSIGALDQAKLDHVDKAGSLHVSNTPAVVQANRKTNGIVLANGSASHSVDSEDDVEDDEDDEEIEDKSDDRDVAEHRDEPDVRAVQTTHEDQDGGDNEPSIQDKLRDLGINITRPMPSASAAPTLDETMHNSRVKVLVQAVRSKNMRMLDDCVTKVQKRVDIRHTVDQLSSEMAIGALLDVLVARMEAFPVRADCFVPWIREVIIEHAGALLAQQHNSALVALNAFIDSRTQPLDALARLEGRLELIMGQVERLKRSKESGVDGMAVNSYVDEDEDDDDEEEDEEDSESDSENEAPSPAIMDGQDMAVGNDMGPPRQSGTTEAEEEEKREDSDGDEMEVNGEAAEARLAQVLANGVQKRKNAATPIESMDDSEKEEESSDEVGDEDEDSDVEMEVEAPAKAEKATHEMNGKMPRSEVKKTKSRGANKAKKRAAGAT